jgi:hypothetical protein
LVREYLIASGERRMDDAGRYLDAAAIIIFPQGRFENLHEMAEAMKGRYLSIAKTHDTWDVSIAESETVVVTTGTLNGVNTHGISFEGVRFCDRFVIRNGLIVEQHVWNDLAESGVLERY